ncbi:4-aminobutyrate--2-oxoglutarate transaminase [Thermus scotoductus]|uniref:4-aminobutyrate--2-oxoglutarate transaminase n=1 Tax=Thermus scotoductus TaxID=37636 RepID=A0A430SDF0_THESC|nr:aminotransferase class III-fold pyridoxal phosphate-dependent enzyme [Thermus scotoductus]RTG96567.1 4-aminobutyrate--2-oxoglutarate transaminase [Thermus scotoductus]RTH11272.1 4-aminobutyrate--2-oxoglutarate transaminase [Thermus scotoductus]RTH12783.1 4-aminobutyrate--2-oxoglutarate transaminase [Thermus scotoductus]RTH13812.1 4-aminobutyrate--2-oxoglutarate transaminase [Thermus scotoductus]RTH19628.1 4-aminobutyrate--2-oxoglutarate transaminase [Thermus scotoductus]
MGYIQLKTAIPGPRSRALMERRAQAVTRALAQANPIAVAKAHGALVEDVDGNILIDLAGGIGALGVGHTPKAVVEAIKAQAENLIHMCAIVANYEPYVALAEALNALYPGPGPAKTLLANGGAEAVENAVKLARAFTGRAGVMVFEGAYHGRTNLTMAMTSKYALFKKGFGPFAPEVYRLPVPNLYRTPPGMTQQEYLDWSLWNLENALVAHIDGSALAAIVIEPVLGEGGFIPVPHAFLRKLREIADRTGAVLIADEVQSGSGRTGRMWAIEHSGVVPDLIVSAKSLGAGMPISAVTGRAEILDAPHVGGVGSTYGGNPLAAVAALEALRILKSPGFLAKAQDIEAKVREIFEPLKEEVPALGDVRGIGAMMALEFVKDPKTKEPWPEFVLELVRRNAEKGVITIRAGLYSNALRFLPPLDIPLDMLEEGLSVVAENIREVYATLA